MIDYQKSLDRVAALTPCDYSEADRDYIETVIDALKKRIPKKPIANTGAPWWTCPTCGGSAKLYLHSVETPFCRWCGQALQWNEGV